MTFLCKAICLTLVALLPHPTDSLDSCSTHRIHVRTPGTTSPFPSLIIINILGPFKSMLAKFNKVDLLRITFFSQSDSIWCLFEDLRVRRSWWTRDDDYEYLPDDDSYDKLAWRTTLSSLTSTQLVPRLVPLSSLQSAHCSLNSPSVKTSFLKDIVIDTTFLEECYAAAKARLSPSSSPWSVLPSPNTNSDTTGASSLQCAMARISPYTYQQFKGYYYGLPSRPTFVASSNTEVWAPPTGAEAYMPVKMLRPVGEHKIVELWEAGLADQVIACLTAIKVEWISFDVSLSGKNGHTMALDARKVLYDKGIEVENHESRVFKSVGPKLLMPVFSSNPLATVADPLAVTLCLPICAYERRDAEGTGGFYVARYGVPDRVFLVTTRHVLALSVDVQSKIITELFAENQSLLPSLSLVLPRHPPVRIPSPPRLQAAAGATSAIGL
ncbi:hypothetical protein V8E53_011048 [Lactarius tabidus]